MSVTFMVSGLGVAVALLSDHAKVTSAVAAVVGIAAGAIAYVAQEARSATDYRRQALTAAAAGAAACYAIAGLNALVGREALVVLVLFTVTSPAAIQSYKGTARRIAARRWVLAHLPGPTAGQTENPVQGLNHRKSSRIHPERLLTDVELCEFWRLSSSAIAQPGSSPSQQARLVAARHGYLDEFERRDTAGFRRWLAAGLQPDRDPSQYFRSTAEQPPVHDREP
jgi:hypothetical protein